MNNTKIIGRHLHLEQIGKNTNLMRQKNLLCLAKKFLSSLRNVKIGFGSKQSVLNLKLFFSEESRSVVDVVKLFWRKSRFPQN